MRNRFFAGARTLFVCCILMLSFSAHAFKIDSHLWVAQQVYNDVSDDGQITVKLRGRSITIPVSDEVASAIRNNKNAFLMGNMGPDALPDVVAGQMVVHPGLSQGWKTNDWLTHLLDRSKGSPVGTALAYGFLSHASADVFSHTYVNQYAGDIFSLLDGETLAEQRHVALEAFIGKHTPPYLDANGTDLGPPYTLVTPRDDVAIFVRDTLIYDPQASAEYWKSPSTLHLPAYLAYRNRILEAANSDLWNRIDAAILQAVAANYGYTISASQASALVNYLNNKVIPAIQNQQNDAQEKINGLSDFASQIDVALGNKLLGDVRILSDLQATINQKLIERVQWASQTACDWDRYCYKYDYACKALIKWKCVLTTEASTAINKIDSAINNARNQQLNTLQQLRDQAVVTRDSSLRLAQRIIDLSQAQTSNTSPIKAYLNNWVNDLDLAMAEYVKAASNTMINTMNPASRNQQYGAFAPMVYWFDCYHRSLAGIPGVVGSCEFQKDLQKTLDALNDAATIVQDASSLPTYVNPSLGLPTPAEVRAAVTDLQARAKKALTDAAITEFKKLIPVELSDIITVLSEDMTDANLKKYYTKLETVVPPKKLLMMTDIVSRIKGEMHLKPGGTDGVFDPEQYAVVYDAVVLAKLAMLDNAGLTQLAQEAGVPLNADGMSLFEGTDNVIAHAVASIDGNHQWMNDAPPYPNSVGISPYPFKRPGDYDMSGYPWPNGYAAAAGLKLWAPEARGALFRSLFIGPLSPGIEAPEELGLKPTAPAVLPANYTYRPCKAYPFPNNENDGGCKAIKVLPAILDILLE